MKLKQKNRKDLFSFLFSLYFRPFDPQYYEDEFEDEEMLDEEGRTRLKLKVRSPSFLPFSTKWNHPALGSRMVPVGLKLVPLHSSE